MVPGEFSHNSRQEASEKESVLQNSSGKRTWAKSKAGEKPPAGMPQNTGFTSLQ